jgi:hypothetical protein
MNGTPQLSRRSDYTPQTGTVERQSRGTEGRSLVGKAAGKIRLRTKTARASAALCALRRGSVRVDDQPVISQPYAYQG